jgi:hypothetical protein
MSADAPTLEIVNIIPAQAQKITDTQGGMYAEDD